MPSSHSPLHVARGIGLVEVLATLVIVSVGMLAVVGLLAQSIAVRSSELQQLRAQRMVRDAGELTALFAADAGALLAAPPSGSGSPCPGVTHCSSLALAQQLYGRWRQQVAADLPSGHGRMQLHTTAIPASVEVRITWQDNRGHSHALTRRFPLPQPA